MNAFNIEFISWQNILAKKVLTVHKKFHEISKMFHKLDHIAIICRDYEKSKIFYTETLGFKIISETYRSERKSYKLDLSLNGEYLLELFSFPDPPARLTNPEATGLRHISFEVDDIKNVVEQLKEKGVESEPIRLDEKTGKQFTFFFDPDGLPVELYEK